ncbi:MAG: serine/threonine protein kinase [Planctomycetales bacterium]|nr:serine/threonine protein kinase [Planctomycetales bacterium]
MPEPKNIEQIIADLVQAGERGERVDLSHWIDVYPQFAQELKEFFEIHDRLVSPDHSQDTEKNPVDATVRLALQDGEVLDGQLSGTNPPRFLGEYEIISEINRGGMGVVYKARHRKLGRLVALKLIRSGELANEEEIQRFRSEAEAAAALTHPGIVPIFEVGTLQGLVYFTMAYIEGESLAAVTQNGPMDVMEAVRIIHKLCAAVDHAHRSGVFHRDLKPANVLLDGTGQPILIDFGLAKIAYRESSLTTTGQILGTPAYMAPEHATGKIIPITAASDVYSIGAILYVLLAGQPPFGGPTPIDVLLQVLDHDPPFPSQLNHHVSHELDFVCRKALEKKPESRYQTAAQMADDLHRILQGTPLDFAHPTVMARLESWWRREPILLVHICGIGVTTAIVCLSQLSRWEMSVEFPLRLGLLVTWLVASFFLQIWVLRARWRDLACLTWMLLDVTIYTTLLAFADPPRSMLLIGYPMMVVASSLFYRKRFVVVTTLACIGGFTLLGLLSPMQDFVKLDFAAIFVAGLSVICLTVLSTIRRVRSMSLYSDDK